MNEIRGKYKPGEITRSGLTIIEYIGNKTYKCISACECKKEIVVPTSFIHKQKYCGTDCFESKQEISNRNKKNILGQKFGKLIVVKMSPKRTSTRNIFWECICECGNIRIVDSYDLRHNQIKCCVQCATNNNKINIPTEKADVAITQFFYPNYNTNEERAIARRFKMIKKGARERNILFEITKEDYQKIAFSSCVFCGKLDTKTFKYNNSFFVKNINGIDRINNLKGYINENIQSCCYRCNQLKGTFEEKEFLDYIMGILKYRGLIS